MLKIYSNSSYYSQLCHLSFVTYYSKNYAGILGSGLLLTQHVENVYEMNEIISHYIINCNCNLWRIHCPRKRLVPTAMHADIYYVTVHISSLLPTILPTIKQWAALESVQSTAYIYGKVIHYNSNSYHIVHIVHF